MSTKQQGLRTIPSGIALAGQMVHAMGSVEVVCKTTILPCRRLSDTGCPAKRVLLQSLITAHMLPDVLQVQCKCSTATRQTIPGITTIGEAGGRMKAVSLGVVIIHGTQPAADDTRKNSKIELMWWEQQGLLNSIIIITPRLLCIASAAARYNC